MSVITEEKTNKINPTTAQAFCLEALSNCGTGKGTPTEPSSLA